jgi:hypothetical protein
MISASIPKPRAVWSRAKSFWGGHHGDANRPGRFGYFSSGYFGKQLSTLRLTAARVANRVQIWENGAGQALVGRESIRVNSMNDELQVIDLQPGDGKAAVKGALITTQYRGWLEDGTSSTPPTAGASLSSA